MWGEGQGEQIRPNDELTEEFVIFRMASDPKPDKSVGSFNC